MWDLISEEITLYLALIHDNALLNVIETFWYIEIYDLGKMIIIKCYLKPFYGNNDRIKAIL